MGYGYENYPTTSRSIIILSTMHSCTYASLFRCAYLRLWVNDYMQAYMRIQFNLWSLPTHNLMLTRKFYSSIRFRVTTAKEKNSADFCTNPYFLYENCRELFSEQRISWKKVCGCSCVCENYVFAVFVKN